MKYLPFYALLAMLPLYFVWIFPQQNKAEVQASEITELVKVTTDYQEKIKKLKDVDQLLKDERYKGVLERIPEQLNQETLIVLIDRIAQSAGFVFEGLQFSVGQDPVVETTTINVDFTIKGRAENFEKFLVAIEKSPRFMGIENFAYSIETINNIDVISMSVPLYAFAQSSDIN